jgi:hypothetical protein
MGAYVFQFQLLSSGECILKLPRPETRRAHFWNKDNQPTTFSNLEITRESFAFGVIDHWPAEISKVATGFLSSSLDCTVMVRTQRHRKMSYRGRKRWLSGSRQDSSPNEKLQGWLLG